VPVVGGVGEQVREAHGGFVEADLFVDLAHDGAARSGIGGRWFAAVG
jgi:hypothetical protein